MIFSLCRGIAQSGSASALGAEGRGFKSLCPDHSYYRWCGILLSFALAACLGVAAAAAWAVLDDAADDDERIPLPPSPFCCCSAPLMWAKGTVGANVGRLWARAWVAAS